MGFQEVTTPEQFETVYPLMKLLRPHVDWDNFMELYLSARRHDDYTMVAELDGDKPLGVMGYRVLYDYVHGKHLYIDDLVIAPEMRSKGLGAAMLKFAERVAKEKGCQGLRLCTGTENEAGIRFYQREGWTLRAHAFKKNFG